MSRLTRELRRMWRGEQGALPRFLAGLTLPPSLLFRAGAAVRNGLYDRAMLPVHSGSIPVVSVGNLAVGGTGKTPISSWLVTTLADAGWSPALVTRAYGEDEILLHRRWNPEVPVLRAPRRIDGVREAVRIGRDVVVVDDGFQHRALARDLDLVLISPSHPLSSRLLPRGPLREPMGSLSRADLVLVTAKGPAQLTPARAMVEALSQMGVGRRIALFPFEVGRWQTLDGTPANRPAGPPLAVASVAEPEGFLRLVTDRVDGSAPSLLTFRDHYEYGPADLRHIRRESGGRWIATTEKDAVKLIAFREQLPETRVLPLTPAPPEGLGQWILSRLGRKAAEREKA